MKIRAREGRYTLYDNNREIKLNNYQRINDNGATYEVSLVNYYKDLHGKELGAYDDIIGKTFEHIYGSRTSAVLSKDFVKFLDKKNRE